MPLGGTCGPIRSVFAPKWGHGEPEAQRRRARETADPAPVRELVRRSPKSYLRPLTARECATLERKARGMTQKLIAFEFGISVNTVGNLAANAYRKLGVHGAAAAVHAHRDAHPWCGSRIDFGPIRERLRAARAT